jgi:hypothetical protein
MYCCLRYRYRYDYSASSAAANTIAALVAALADAELSCTVISYNCTYEYMIIPPDRFKHRYHGFAPELEINQMVSSNPYYVTGNSFMVFTTSGLRKNLYENPAGHL